MSAKSTPLDDDVWELYDTTKDLEPGPGPLEAEPGEVT